MCCASVSPAHPLLAYVVFLASTLLVGCADPTTGQVSGIVTVDGQPAKTGSIALFPVNGQGGTAGAAIKDGKYEAEVKFGEFKVEIRVPKVVGQAKLYNTADSPMKNIMQETLPPKYHDQTELRLEIKPGENHQDINLTTK